MSFSSPLRRSAHPTERGSVAPSSIPFSDPSQVLDEGIRARVLLVDDEPTVRRTMARLLSESGYEVEAAASGEEAVHKLADKRFDVVLSDIGMPRMNGIQLLRAVRQRDAYVPVVLLTGEPAIETAAKALEYGAFRYLTKPVRFAELESALDKGAQLRRMALLKQQAAELLGNRGLLGVDRIALETSFDRAMKALWIAYQPIVNAKKLTTYGYEALLRTEEPSLPHPGAVLDAAERLERLEELGVAVRERAAENLRSLNEGFLFVNLHVADLLDPDLYSATAPLSGFADRVVLEITERCSLDPVNDVRSRVAALREMGFRIAVDDMGAGYAGLTSFTVLEPEIVKLDMSLVRGVHRNRTKQKVIRSMAALSQDMGMIVVAEGVEDPDERDVLVDLGCDLLQGRLFAYPGRPFPEPIW